MKCPCDSTEMHQVTVASHYGQNITLEQCALCGGIWFDKSELHRTKQGEAEKVESVSIEKLRTPSTLKNKKFLCPKDGSVLLEFKDTFFPKGINMQRCGMCDGFWLNCGEFSKYQQVRQALQVQEKEEKHEEEIDENVLKILEAHSSKNMTEAMGNLSAFLSTPINRYTLRPEGEKNETSKQVMIISIILRLVSMLMRRGF